LAVSHSAGFQEGEQMTDPVAPVSVVSAAIEPAPAAQEPVVVTVVGNRGTGTGGTVTTAAGRPDIIIKVVQPLLMILVRAGRVFLQTLLGLLSAGMVAPKALPAADFLHLLVLCSGLSLASAVICVIQNGIELLGKIDQKFPTLAG
jgi:hypothetical protein